MAKRYMKKPVEIEAAQYTGSNFDEVQAFCPDVFIEDGHLMLRFGHSVFAAPDAVGSYVYKGPSGEFYLCSKREFESSYVELDDRHCLSICSLY